MTREELRDRIIERAAEAERKLESGEFQTLREQEKARETIARALAAMDYGDAGGRPAVRESAAQPISDRLK